jgi:hypothetical protein
MARTSIVDAHTEHANFEVDRSPELHGSSVVRFAGVQASRTRAVVDRVSRMGAMSNSELDRLEGVWTGIEHVTDGAREYDALGRLVFQCVFDGRFVLCDHMQTAHGRPTAFAHGVFRRDEHTNALTVTWFRSPAPTRDHHTDAVTGDDRLMFLETIDGRATRTSYSMVRDRLSVYTERAAGDDWKRIFEGSYRRR